MIELWNRRFLEAPGYPKLMAKREQDWEQSCGQEAPLRAARFALSRFSKNTSSRIFVD